MGHEEITQEVRNYFDINENTATQTCVDGATVLEENLQLCVIFFFFFPFHAL